MKAKNTCWLAAALAAAGMTTTTTAFAQDGDDVDVDDDDRGIERPSGFGIGVTLGGGIAGYTDELMRDVANDAGGLWELRVAIGTHVPFGIEAAYLGTSSTLDSDGMDNGMLVGTIVEAAARYNLRPEERWNPFLFVGAGWQRLDTTDTNLSPARTGVADSDNIAVFPMGAGLTYRDPTGVTGELRGTFRAAADADLVRDLDTMDGDDDVAALHMWQAAANVGYEF